jgi:hypothetical protein
LVTRLPLEKLWSDDGECVGATCLGAVGRHEITQLLRNGPVLFVVAGVGRHLVWIDRDYCHAFWKREAKPHLAEPEDAIELSNFPGEYAYIARKWIAGWQAPVVVLEKHH